MRFIHAQSLMSNDNNIIKSKWKRVRVLNYSKIDHRLWMFTILQGKRAKFCLCLWTLAHSQIRERNLGYHFYETFPMHMWPKLWDYKKNCDLLQLQEKGLLGIFWVFDSPVYVCDGKSFKRKYWPLTRLWWLGIYLDSSSSFLEISY